MEKNLRFTKTLFYILFCSTLLSGQNKIIDSLKLVISSTSLDTVKVNAQNAICKILWQSGQLDSSLNYAEVALQLSKKINFKKGIANAYANQGVIYLYKPNYDRATEVLLIANKLYTELSNKKRIADTYNNLGEVHKYKGLYPVSIKYHFLALKIREEIKDSIGVAGSLNNIAIVYEKQSNYSAALTNYFNALKVYQRKKLKSDIARTYNNIAEVFRLQNKLNEALNYQLKSLEIRKEINEVNGIAMSYNNLGTIKYSLASLKLNAMNEPTPAANIIYEEALNYYKMAKNIIVNTGDIFFLSNVELNIGIIYSNQKKYIEAEASILKSLNLSKSTGNKELIKRAYSILSEIYEKRKNYKAAYEVIKLFIKYKDSLINEENTKKTIEAQMQYAFDKKETIAKAEQKQKDIISKKEKEKQKVFLYVVIIGLITVLIFTFFIYNRFKITKRQKKIIELKEKEAIVQNELLTHEKNIVEEKQNEILSSIRYAKRIQQSLMPTEKYIDRVINKKP